MMDFDEWFDSQGYDEQHREMFRGVWNAALEQTDAANRAAGFEYLIAS
jgi:hypothetical protein